MKTEYGYRKPSGEEVWLTDSGAAEHLCRMVPGYTFIAREVSEARVVSIRG